MMQREVIFLKRRISAMAAVFILIFSISANAATRASLPRAVLTFSGTKAQCSVTVSASGKDIEATVTLFHLDGGVKVAVGYWPDLSATGNLRFAETCTVEKGERYELRVECTIDGVKQPTISDYGAC